MKINTVSYVNTYNGGKAVKVSDFDTLKRIVLASMLFEDNFYESGVEASKRLVEVCARLKPEQIMNVAIDASTKYRLRHVPLQLIVEALKHRDCCYPKATQISEIINRPDMITDLVALYWKNGKVPLANKLKQGLALAFDRFDEYQLAKYNRNNPIKLRDVAMLCHVKAGKDKKKGKLFADLINKTHYPEKTKGGFTVKSAYGLDGQPGLQIPDTWEVKLCAGEDKKESFQELLEKGKLGKLAILRNMRNMHDSGVPRDLVYRELIRNPQAMLPFQYLAAAKACPQWEDIIDEAMIKSASLKPMLKGKTILLVDVSGSMTHPLSKKSQMSRMDAACGLAILLRECCQEVYIMSFSDAIMNVPPRRGMALRDAIIKSQPNSGTYLGQCLQHVLNAKAEFDRLIVITDEQTNDVLPNMPKTKNYILNIGSYTNGIGKQNQWTTITGFSEAVLDFMLEYEKEIE